MSVRGASTTADEGRLSHLRHFSLRNVCVGFWRALAFRRPSPSVGLR